MVKRPAMTTSPLTLHLADMRLRDLATTHMTARRRAVERLADYLDRDALTVTTDELRRYLGSLPRTTPRSRYAEQSHLICYLRWATQHGHLDHDPSVTIPRPRLTRLLPRPISEPDLTAALLGAPARERMMLVLAAYAGLRACEIAALDRSDILDHAPIPCLVAHGKGRKDRVVPLSATVLTELRDYGLPARGPLFPRRDGQPGRTSAARVSKDANAVLHGLGIVDTLHSLRHRFATATYAASQDILVVAALLGHSDPATTAGYAAWSQQAAAAAVRALDVRQDA